MKNTKTIADERKETLEYIKAAVPISAALVLFLVSAGFIAYKFVLAYRHNERWKDYDECGIQ